MTGSRGPVSKPEGQRQRRNRKPSALVIGAGMAKPAAPKELLSATVKKWDAFWSSELATTMREEHLPMIDRLFVRYDERERAVRVIRAKGRLTHGSQGQLVLHPLLKLIDSCEAAILQMEDRLGISPRNRVGAGTGSGKPGSLDEVNSRLSGDHEDTADDADEDPREYVAGSIGK